MSWVFGHEHGHAGGLGNHSVQQLHAFDARFSGKKAHACHVAPGTRDAGDKPGAYWDGDVDHDNEDLLCCPHTSDGPEGCLSDNGVASQRNELGGKAWETLGLATRPALI